MINNFGVLSKSGQFLMSILGIQRNMYNNTEDLTSLEFFNQEGNGLCWESFGKIVKVFPKDESRLIGYPSVDLNHVVVIYFPYNNVEFPAPSNAVIYNADGSVKCVLTPPALVSEIAKRVIVNSQPTVSTGFESVMWNKDLSSNVVTSLWIGFGFDGYEERVLNINFGHLMECLGSGRI